MVKKAYSWLNGAVLDEHSRKKHKILEEYISRYIETRCRLHKQTSFRVGVVDGFAGGGRYQCGAPGSPLIMLSSIREGEQKVNLWRASQGMQPIQIFCDLILNDGDRDAIALLEQAMAPVLAEIQASSRNLHVQTTFKCGKWEDVFPVIFDYLQKKNFRNVVFNLDQYGHGNVSPKSVDAIMRGFASPEIFLTFAIKSWLAFLQTSNKVKLDAQLSKMGVGDVELKALSNAFTSQEMLGLAEKLVFEFLKDRAPYVSPFSIHNPNGWRYWMLHLARSPRARQVYNDILHENSSYQAHYGRAGLKMLQYNPHDEAGFLYLFDKSAREVAFEQLAIDIPKFVSGAGDALIVSEFYEQVYNETPAHADDIRAAMIASPDIEVLSEKGVERRRPAQIVPADVLRLKSQKHFFDILTPSKPNG